MANYYTQGFTVGNLTKADGTPYKGSTTSLAGIGGTAGGTAGGTIQALIDEFLKMTNAANAANEARYGEGKGELTDLRTRALAAIKNLGISQLTDINREFSGAATKTLQDLAGRGLANSTITPSIMAGLTRQKTEAQAKAAESRALQAIGLDQSTTNDLVGFIERRNDIAPDLGILAQLAMSLGQYGTGGAGGYSRSVPSPYPVRYGSNYGSNYGGSGGGYDPLNPPRLYSYNSKSPVPAGGFSNQIDYGALTGLLNHYSTPPPTPSYIPPVFNDLPQQQGGYYTPGAYANYA